MADAAAESTPSCPKCGTAQRPGARACPRCGLSGDRMAAFEQARDASVPDAVTAAWDHAVAGWDELDRHDALLALISRHDAYAWGAARYREVQRERADDAMATRQLDRLRRAAEATLLATATPAVQRTASPYRASTAVLAMLIVAAIAGLLYATLSRNRVPASTGATPAPTPLTPIKPPPPPPKPSTN